MNISFETYQIHKTISVFLKVYQHTKMVSMAGKNGSRRANSRPTGNGKNKKKSVNRPTH